jgi:hypothetical protein
VATRLLTPREREILHFLLDAPGLPDRDVLMRQADVALVDGMCGCGCASIGLRVDPSAAPQARPLPRPVVEAFADDLQLVNRWQRLTVLGDDLVYDQSLPVPDDLSGVIGLMLFPEDGWLSYLEIWSAGDFQTPEVFPPPEVFGHPQISELLSTPKERPTE